MNTTRLPSLPVAALTLLIGAGLAADPAQALTINFDDLPDCTGSYNVVHNGYRGLNWENFYCMDPDTTEHGGSGSGFDNMRVSPPNHAFSGFASSAELSRSDGGTFTLTSAFVAAAWMDDLAFRVKAFADGVLAYDETYTVNTSGPVLLEFGMADVDRVVFSTYGGVNAGHGGYGQHFAIDDLVIAGLPPPPAPAEPRAIPTLSVWSLLGLSGVMAGIAALAQRRRK